MYLFLRCKFKWNEADYSYFFAYKMAFISLGKISIIVNYCFTKNLVFI